MTTRRSLVALALTCLVAVGTVAPASVAAARDVPSTRGSSSIEPRDDYFPKLGNGGYDVQHYDVAISTDKKMQSIDGTVTITAKATQALSRFDLDLEGLDVKRVEVDGSPVRFDRKGAELRIRPKKTLADGDAFRVVVKYDGEPTRGQIESVGLTNGWLDLDHSVVT